MSNQFFNKINYSACNEDSESELQALSLTKSDTLLCITASGARPLDLLIGKPKKIISIDFNRTQNYLLSLKIAAYKTLNYSEFLSFIGVNNNKTREVLYNRVTLWLSEEVKKYWDTHYHIIEKWLLYSGTWEKLLIWISKLWFTRKKKLWRLLGMKTLQEQKNYWDRHWDNKIWKIFLYLLCNKFLWKRIIKEPWALLISNDFSIYEYIHSRLNYLVEKHQLSENHFANLVFLWKYSENCILPLHLREENFDTIKQQVDKIEIITDSLENIVNREELMKNITAYSLSDFWSYADDSNYSWIWKNIVKYSRNDAKFCERQFLVKRKPDFFSKWIQRDQDLEKKLYTEDNTVFYTFCAWKINNTH